MKFAFMSYSFPEMTLPELFEAAQQYGYSGLEPRVSSKHGHGLELDCDAATRKQARELQSRTGVAICCIATSCRFSDPATSDAAVTDAQKAIDLAADVGSPFIRVFGGTIGQGLSRQQAVEHAASQLRKLTGQADQRNVTITIETHDHWCDPADMAALLKAVDHPRVAANWDLMHPVFTAGKTIDEAFETLRPWIAHVHCHDCQKENGERILCPIGQGIVDHKRAFEHLKAINYNGYISGEWIRWQPGEEHLPRELAAMKTML